MLSRCAGAVVVVAGVLLAVQAEQMPQADAAGAVEPDTIVTISDLSTADSIRGVPPLDTMVRTRDTTTANEDTARADTVKFWLSPYWGVGVAWTLGSSPLFSSWESSIPTALTSLPIPAYLSLTDSTIGDSARVRFIHQDKPGTYNIDFPFNVQFTPLATQRHALKVDLTLAFQYKKSDIAIKADSLDGMLALRQSLGLYFTAIGATYTLGIPEEYFSVENTVRSALAVGLGIVPFAWVERTDRLEIAKSTHPDLRAQADTLKSLLQSAGSYGFGFTWTAGISAIKVVSERSGMQMSVCYQGRWMIFPELTSGSIKGDGRSAGTTALSATVHRFALLFDMVRGKRADAEAEEAVEQAPAPAPTPAVPAPVPVDKGTVQ